ncbi:hypothetical protein BDW75DRAFT_202038 [Aspergillus navahoensis]
MTGTTRCSDLRASPSEPKFEKALIYAPVMLILGFGSFQTLVLEFQAQSRPVSSPDE